MAVSSKFTINKPLLVSFPRAIPLRMRRNARNFSRNSPNHSIHKMPWVPLSLFLCVNLPQVGSACRKSGHWHLQALKFSLWFTYQDSEKTLIGLAMVTFPFLTTESRKRSYSDWSGGGHVTFMTKKSGICLVIHTAWVASNRASSTKRMGQVWTTLFEKRHL